MRNQEAQISDWKARLYRWLPPGREEALAELEDHLRSSVADLVRSGVPADAAVSEAIHRIGEPAEVGRELAKVPVVDRPWLPARFAVIVGLVVAALTLWAMAPRVAAGGNEGLLAAHMGLLALGYLATAVAGLIASLFLVIRLVREPLPAHKRTLRGIVYRSSAVAAVFVGSGLALSLLIAHQGPGRFVGLNGFQIGAATIFVANLVMFAGCRRRSPGSRIELRMLFGVAANVALVLGFYGALLVERSGAIAGGLSWLVLLLLSQAALAAAALAPANCLQIRNMVSR